MNRTLRLNFEGETGVGHIDSSGGKVWRCEDYVWFSVVVTGVIRGVERGVRGGRTKPMPRRTALEGYREPLPALLPQEPETCEAHSLPSQLGSTGEDLPSLPLTFSPLPQKDCLFCSRAKRALRTVAQRNQWLEQGFSIRGLIGAKRPRTLEGPLLVKRGPWGTLWKKETRVGTWKVSCL